MKTTGFVLALLALASASILWDDLRVKWAFLADDPQRLSSLYKIPRTQEDAMSADWVEVKGVNSLCASVYCMKDDPRFCVLFDGYGHIAGFQAGLPACDIEYMQSIYNLSNIDTYQLKTMFNEPVWTSTLYTVDPAIIKTGGRCKWNNLTGTEGIWIEKKNGYMIVPKKLADLDSMWLKQACVNEQGTHYYWNMSTNLLCEDTMSWFLLYQNGCLVGGGLEGFGKTTIESRNWYENLTVPIKYIIPESPQCVTDWIDLYDLIFMHFFLIEEPWLYTCPV